MKLQDLRCLKWIGEPRDGYVSLLDQRILPETERWVDCRDVASLAEGIRNMTLRGAPAIGIAAAYGMVLATREAHGSREKLAELRELLAATRPTAVNLFWALNLAAEQASRDASPEAMLKLALKIHEDDIQGNLKMGEIGARHIKDGMGVLTHCNAGALATGGVGTALGVIFVAFGQGRKLHVYVDETRPRLQGAKLTTWELKKMGVPFTLICDNMAASLMAKEKIQFCVTGADRIAANGDAANKIGTYSVAVNANHHGIPFHVAAPRSTFDLAIRDGKEIPIEERSASEVTDQRIPVYNPAFDVTPAKLIRSIFTERGEIAPVNEQNVRKILLDGAQ